MGDSKRAQDLACDAEEGVMVGAIVFQWYPEKSSTQMSAGISSEERIRSSSHSKGAEGNQVDMIGLRTKDKLEGPSLLTFRSMGDLDALNHVNHTVFQLGWRLQGWFTWRDAA